MKWIRWGLGCLFAVALLGANGAVWAQTSGEIRGVVQDVSGAVVPGATVTATMTGTGAARTVASEKDGSFDIPELPVGIYALSAEAGGFKKFVAKNVEVSIGHVNFLTVTLQVGASEQTVTVEANAVQVETTSTQLGGVMSEQSVRELPLATRNTYQLLQLQPGVQSQLGADLFYGSDNPGVVSVNGGRGRSNNYMVNGGDGNDIFVNGPAIQPSPDAIQEFRVITNTFDAEYGRNSGSVVNVVTKSGTNQVHGDFYEFFRNNVLNTKGYFDNGVAPYRQNQFGGTLGGPIKKDKTFIFGSYEGDRLARGISSGTVQLPTADEAAGNFSEPNSQNIPQAAPFAGGISDQTFANVLQARPGCQSAITAGGGAPIAVNTSYASLFPNNQIPTACFDPTANALYQLYVAPTGTGTVSTVPARTDREDQFTIRFDHNITSSQKFTAYYYFDDDHRTEPFAFFQAAGANVPGFGSIFGTRAQQWNLTHTWTIGSTAVNEFHFNYFREGQKLLDHPVSTFQSVHDVCGTLVPTTNCFADPSQPPSAGITTNLPGHVGVPFVSVSGGFAIGNNSEGELPQVGNTFQWTDNFTKTFGKHTVKFGGDVRRERFDQFLYYNINGSLGITNDANADQIGFTDTSGNNSFPAYPNYFLGAANGYVQGAGQAEDLRNTALYLFAQDSYKLKSNLTLNYGLRWELNTPYYDTGNRLQTFRPGQVETQYPCWLSQENAATLGLAPGDCGQNSGANNAVFPLGLVFPNDTGIQRGLTSTYFKAFAPRIGLAWSPGWTEGWLAKLSGGPGKLSIRAGYGIFYNPIEQLVLEQFSAEPPFGGSTALSNVIFNTPFLTQTGTLNPNPFGGIINQTPKTPCAVDTPGGPNGCVDWSSFRPILPFGEFQPNMKSQYSEQYNLTIERQLTKDMLFRIAYVGTQAHHLLASYDLDYGHAETCLQLNNIMGSGFCGSFGSDASYVIPANTPIPSYTPAPGTPYDGCAGLSLPYNAGSGGNCVQPTATGLPNPITLVGLRKYSSPNCQPLTSIGCPADGVPVFSNIFAENTIANSAYNSLQVSLEKSYSHGLLFQASYTWSKAIDQGASFENELNPLNFNATRGLSLLDAKNRFVFSPVWELPVPKYAGFKGKALDGWGASAIITYQSGFPIRVQNQDDTELESSIFFEDANTPQATGPVQFVNPKAIGNNHALFLSGNIADSNLGTFGNMPHALCCGTPISDTDLVISKKTGITDRWSTEFRAEFFNTWNHTQFANPDGNFSDSTFGQILTTREDPRVIQFGLKFFF